MQCPLCKNEESVGVAPHVDGFAKDAYQCGACGGIWTYSNDMLKIIKGRVQKRQKVCTDFVCPTCKHMVSHETELNAFQFHEEHYECFICGTICSVAHDHIEVIKDSQKDSFLDTTGDLVESDDYNTI